MMAQLSEEYKRRESDGKKRVVVWLQLEGPAVDLEEFNDELGHLKRHLESSLKWLNEQNQLIEPDYLGWRIRTFVVDDASASKEL
jgi:hypothetical protein